MSDKYYSPEPIAPDWCGRDGAYALKEKIESYWKARGFSVQIIMQPAGFLPSMRSARMDIRSTMRNGLPPAALVKKAA